jgi:predicted nucleic acid-binding protein
VTFIELGPAFGGDPKAAELFLSTLSISTSEPWNSADSEMAHGLWHEHQLRRRALQAAKRPVADILIAAFARRFQGIITRNGADFRSLGIPLSVVEP